MKTRLLFACIIIALLQGCMSQPDVMTNDDIDAGLRKSIAENSELLVNALWRNKVAPYRNLGTDRFNEQDIKSTITMVQKIYFEPGFSQDYTVMDEFYAPRNGSGKITVTSEKNGYSFRFYNNEPEYYVAVIKIHPNEQQHHLVAAVYNKVGKEWKLDNVFPARYSMYGKSANDMLAMAKQWEKRGYMIDAYIHAQGARNLVLHGDKYIVYEKKNEIQDYRAELAKKIQAKYGQFPLTVDEIDSRPVLTDFDIAFHNQGLYPAVHYISNVPENDTRGQEKEYERLKAWIKKEMPDLAASQGYVFYRRFIEYPPASGNTYISNAFIDENKKSGKSK